MNAALKQEHAPRFDRKLCKRCGLCAHFCPQQVIEMGAEGYPYAAHPEKCLGCELCFLRCPDFALEVKEQNAE